MLEWSFAKIVNLYVWDGSLLILVLLLGDFVHITSLDFLIFLYVPLVFCVLGFDFCKCAVLCHGLGIYKGG